MCKYQRKLAKTFLHLSINTFFTFTFNQNKNFSTLYSVLKKKQKTKTYKYLLEMKIRQISYVP